MFSVPSIFQDIECSEAEADVAGTTMAIYTVQAEGDDHDGPGGLFADVGMVLEGVKQPQQPQKYQPCMRNALWVDLCS